jgi:hypothetical protein
MDDQRTDSESGGNVKMRFSLKQLFISTGLICAALGILVCFDAAIPFEMFSPLISFITILLILGLCGALISVAVLLPFTRGEK